MFMFLNYLALGSKQRDLADRYGVHQSTVSRIITTCNFLYTVLGSVRIWIPEEKIRAHLPAEFKDICRHYSHPGLHRAEVPVPFITSSPK
ncbi:hypothetical protein EPR50_G00200290 [Perca flavescens]|uniref:Transposase Helix-turn-helix domain-containing protein n=1 Tax=Perca flavescens TaxID=8167 RepID=A0A484CD95_PERFV|nr:hypothetical protein EPR50_G00200290 [Perca flavescens]